jgi:hypothetical protein
MLETDQLLTHPRFTPLEIFARTQKGSQLKHTPQSVNLDQMLLLLMKYWIKCW